MMQNLVLYAGQKARFKEGLVESHKNSSQNEMDMKHTLHIPMGDDKER
jgi:hypothetical protein